MDRVQATARVGKRKADGQDNERLVKRLSLLNLGLYSFLPLRLSGRSSSWLTKSIERNGERLYVPVEQPSTITSRPSEARQSVQTRDDDAMQLDDSKHKVYIYDLDAELSESDSDDCKLVFLPDIEKHLRQSRIPPSILANSEGELAGEKQVVLYNVPSALTVPEAQDGVRRAIIETRARARANQEQRGETQGGYNGASNGRINSDADSHARYHGMADQGWSTTPTIPQVDDDPDAMDLG
jgi:hypothetical protein